MDRHRGVIGAAGILISLLATFLVLPSWVFLFEDLGKRVRMLGFLDLSPKTDYSMLSGVGKVRDWRGFTRGTAIACRM